MFSVLALNFVNEIRFNFQTTGPCAIDISKMKQGSKIKIFILKYLIHALLFDLVIL